jgi:hypothetical protein
MKTLFTLLMLSAIVANAQTVFPVITINNDKQLAYLRIRQRSNLEAM